VSSYVLVKTSSTIYQYDLDINQLVGSSTQKLESFGDGKFGVFEWDGSGAGVSGFGVYETTF
jgi:hypothetical protein